MTRYAIIWYNGDMDDKMCIEQLRFVSMDEAEEFAEDCLRTEVWGNYKYKVVELKY